MYSYDIAGERTLHLYSLTLGAAQAAKPKTIFCMYCDTAQTILDQGPYFFFNFHISFYNYSMNNGYSRTEFEANRKRYCRLHLMNRWVQYEKGYNQKQLSRNSWEQNKTRATENTLNTEKTVAWHADGVSQSTTAGGAITVTAIQH